jgi:hypothetical protein
MYSPFLLPPALRSQIPCPHISSRSHRRGGTLRGTDRTPPEWMRWLAGSSCGSGHPLALPRREPVSPSAQTLRGRMPSNNELAKKKLSVRARCAVACEPASKLSGRSHNLSAELLELSVIAEAEINHISRCVRVSRSWQEVAGRSEWRGNVDSRDLAALLLVKM